jgi:hypothetical protein
MDYLVTSTAVVVWTAAKEANARMAEAMMARMGFLWAKGGTHLS